MMPQASTRIALFVPVVALLTTCTGDANGNRAASGPGYVVEGGVVQPVNGLPNPYETVRDWGTIPAGRVWGSVSALQTDIDGRHIWVADRCGANGCAGSDVDPILKMDPDGNVVTSFGSGLMMWPHGMHVDEEGNVWIADARSARPNELEQFPSAAGLGHQVIKFSPEGEVLLTIGVGGEAGDPPTHLTEPNDVITGPNGDIYVAESHSGQNRGAGPDTPARINRYSADGTFIMSWGTWGAEPGQFKTPHALAWDSQGRLFVSDRGNNRIQIFDADGNFLEEWDQFSRISGLHIDEDDVLYAIDSESGPERNLDWRKGLRIGSARTGDVWYYIPQHDREVPSGGGGFGAMGEGVTVDAAGNIYGGEVGSVTGLTKFVPRLMP